MAVRIFIVRNTAAVRLEYPEPNATTRASTIASEMSQELSLPIRGLAQISIAEAF